MSPAGAQLEILVPPGVADHLSYRGVWVQNSFLDSIGISSGSLALVVDTRPMRGQPAAIQHKETGEVSCGYFDEAFGFISLEDELGDPTLFEDSDVAVLGKIVGVCRDEKTAEGRMIAQPIRSEKGTG